MNEIETTKDVSGETGGVNLMKNEPHCRLRGLTNHLSGYFIAMII